LRTNRPVRSYRQASPHRPGIPRRARCARSGENLTSPLYSAQEESAMLGELAKQLRNQRSFSSKAKRRARVPTNRRRPWLEPLEDLTVLSVTLFGVPSWNPEGPSPELNGQDENIPSDWPNFVGSNPVSGAIEALAVQPNSNIVYVGGVNGGIWKTEDITSSPVSWSPLTDQFPALQIACLQFDPTDGSNQTLVAGIGLTSSLRKYFGPLTGV